jgi:tetratricopeptide (TPR) repeat protein
LDRAIETTRAALEALPAETEPRTYVQGRYNLALYLTESGRFREAADLLEGDAELYARFPEPWTQLRRSWLQGKIAAGVGEVPAAERLFVETRDGFVRQGIGYDAAMVSLDLALLYLKDGRTGEVRRVAEEMVAIFSAQDVHREATAALLLFQDAARREAVTAEMVREVGAYLEAARGRPALRFGSGSGAGSRPRAPPAAEAERGKMKGLPPGEAVAPAGGTSVVKEPGRQDAGAPSGLIGRGANHTD